MFFHSIVLQLLIFFLKHPHDSRWKWYNYINDLINFQFSKTALSLLSYASIHSEKSVSLLSMITFIIISYFLYYHLFASTIVFLCQISHSSCLIVWSNMSQTCMKEPVDVFSFEYLQKTRQSTFLCKRKMQTWMGEKG